MIYTFNTKDYLIYPVMKSYFCLSELEIYNEIKGNFEILKNQLSAKNISYQKLKGALIPNQEKKKFETCFIIDSTKVAEADYGYAVFEKLIPLLDKNSTYSILCGDYVDILHNVEYSQIRLRNALNEVMVRCNTSRYEHSSQYYLIYFNRLTGPQRWHIVENLLKYPWFIGFADVTHQSTFKSYISYILTHSYVKCHNQIIAAHPSDYDDEENVNMLGYPFEENGYSFISINEENFGSFLSYKIETEIPDETDISFSFNVLFSKFDSMNKLKLKVSDKKWDEYLTDNNRGKGELLNTIGYGKKDKEKFIKEIYKKICSNYIYNLEKNEFDILKFNVCLDLYTINGNYRKTTIALEYLPNTGEISIITVT